MRRKKLSALVVLVELATVLLVSPASAWEFTMKGAWTWELEMVTQTGRSGFFGPHDVAAAPGAGPAATDVAGAYAPYNFWAGQLGYRMVSGSDASWNTQYMTSFMDLRMNKALRVRGIYYVGAWNPPNNAATGNLVASEYLVYTIGGIQQSFSPGYWNALWLSAQLPWGSVSLGKRPSTWGMGLGWNGSFSRSTESLALFALHGPFRFGVSFYSSRNVANAVPPDYYNPNFDKTNKRRWEITAPNITYRCGPVDMGAQFISISTHRGGEGFITDPATRITGRTYRDQEYSYGGAYFKYYTGVIFFNSEMEWYHRTDRNRRLTAAGAPAAGVRDTYIEHYRAASELGVLSGPLKLGLLYAWSSGGDRRNGNQIDRNGILRSDAFTNTGLFKPYSYLMVYSYGLGSFVDGATGYGYVEDASVYGARLDYAIAANLNIYGTFFWGDRASKSGFGWGCIRPDPNFTDGRVIMNSQGVAGAPNIPDINLGWEVDAGSDWKLLEGLTTNITFAYWQPGDWFKYACVDKTVPGWGAQNAGNNWGINPDRTIDPVWAMRIAVNGEF